MTRRLVLTATLASAAVLAVAGTALAEGPGGMGRGMGRDRDGHPIFGILIMLAIAVAAIIGTWLVIRRGATPPVAVVGPAPTSVVPPVLSPAVSPTASAESILAERLARSEISADDYRATLAALRGAPLPPSAEPTPAE